MSARNTVEQTECLLLDRLPVELREAIYMYALASNSTEDGICISPSENVSDTRDSEKFCAFTIRPDFPSLLRTSPQLRQECLKLFFSSITFDIHIFDSALQTPQAFLSVLPVIALKSIRSLRITFKYLSVEFGMRSWSNALDELVAGGLDPMTAFTRLPGYLYWRRRKDADAVIGSLKQFLNEKTRVKVLVEEFDQDMFPHIWGQVWRDSCEGLKGVEVSVRKMDWRGMMRERQDDGGACASLQ